MLRTVSGLLILFGTAAASVIGIAATALVRRLRLPPRKTLAVAMARQDPTDPADLRLDAEAVTLRLSRGEATPGWIIRGQRPDGPVVVVLHGFGDSRFGALTRVPAIAPHASHVVVFDQRGQGESQTRASCLGRRESADLLGVLEQLPMVKPVVVAGHSMGAGIALATANQTDRIVGLILEAPYRTWDEPVRTVFRMHRYPIWPIVPLAGLILRVLVRCKPFDRVAEAAALDKPMLVLHAEDDPIVPIDAAKAIAAAAPRATLEVFPTGKHDRLALDEPDRYARAIAAFLATV
jgi:pimeloyl-ACP methyl ester carboxylesterase